MKLIPLIVYLVCATSVYGQYDYKSDTNCYSYQHIAVGFKPSNITLYNSKDSSTFDFYDAIRIMNRARKLQIYGYDESYKLSARRANTDREISEFEKNLSKYAFIKYSWNPLMDEYGEPVTRKLNDSTSVFVYPPDDTLAFTFLGIQEFRIEERLNYETKELEIASIGIAVMDDYEQVVELFRVDYDELLKAIRNIGWSELELPWLTLLKTKSYFGFRYKMGSCNDSFDR